MTIIPDPPLRPFWVFGYGSLMWNPGFDIAERRLATLHDFHRSFCMSSIHHRGTLDEPGLVLALDPAPGASCRGVAFRIADDRADAALRYLRERELVSSAYVEKVVPVFFDGGGGVEALAYVVDTAHEQYVGGMELEEQAQIIARAHGGRGPNRDYLKNTVLHLEELAIEDPDLRWLDCRVADILASDA